MYTKLYTPGLVHLYHDEANAKIKECYNLLYGD